MVCSPPVSTWSFKSYRERRFELLMTTSLANAQFWLRYSCKFFNFHFHFQRSLNGDLLTYVPFWPPKSFTIHRTDLQSVPSPLLRHFNYCLFYFFGIPATTNLISPDKFQVVAWHIGAVAHFNIALPISANRYLFLQANKPIMSFKVRQRLTGQATWAFWRI